MKKLYRSRFGSIGGVCKGLSDYFEVDESIIRILFVVLFFTPFPIFLTYLFMWMIIPIDPVNYG